METRARVKRVLEIPARKSKSQNTTDQKASDKSFHLVINLWIIKYEYFKEQFRDNSWELEQFLTGKALETASFFLTILRKPDVQKSK